MSDFFVKLLKYSQGQEDLFTECLAETLRQDQRLARGFVQVLTSSSTGRGGMGSVFVATQESYPHACIDMVLRTDTATIWVEHKLRSREGSEAGTKTQLAKYLALPQRPDHLAFITGYPTTVAEKVRSDRRYLRPATGDDHFHWRDFYDIIARHAAGPNACPLTEALLALFKERGFDPPLPDIGELSLDETCRANRVSFGKLWDLTRRQLRQRGWGTFIPSSQAGLEVKDRSPQSEQGLGSFWLWPGRQDGSLVMRLNMPPERFNHVRARLESADSPHQGHLVIEASTTARKGGKILVLDVMISLRRLLAEARDATQRSICLANFVSHVLEAAE
jgi:hypothetical protein